MDKLAKAPVPVWTPPTGAAAKSATARRAEEFAGHMTLLVTGLQQAVTQLLAENGGLRRTGGAQKQQMDAAIEARNNALAALIVLSRGLMLPTLVVEEPKAVEPGGPAENQQPGGGGADGQHGDRVEQAAAGADAGK